MIKKILIISVLMLTGSVVAVDHQKGVIPEGSGSEGPKLGQPASAEEVAALSINVFPDGRGLPEGSGSVTQGVTIYQSKCIVCHGAGGLGGSAEPLAGAEMGLTGEWPEKTIGTLWPYATTLFDFT